MSTTIPACPSCYSESVSFNGHTRHGKQNHKCRDCGRQFVLNPQWKPLSQEQRELIDRLLLERISLAGIARVMQRSDDCIQRYVNQKAQTVSTQVEVTTKPKKRLTVQMDELWSFVDDKDHDQWVWLALDAETREIVGVYIGDRSGASAQALWMSLPAVYRQCAVIYTDRLSSPILLPYPANVIALWIRIVAIPVILSDLTTRFGSGYLDWCAKGYPSRKSSKITLPQLGILFITTTSSYDSNKNI